MPKEINAPEGPSIPKTVNVDRPRGLPRATRPTPRNLGMPLEMGSSRCLLLGIDIHGERSYGCRGISMYIAWCGIGEASMALTIERYGWRDSLAASQEEDRPHDKSEHARGDRQLFLGLES